MDYIELEQSSISALKHFGFITFEGEKITIPAADEIADRMVTVDRANDSEKRWRNEGLATYVILHTLNNGKKIIADFDSIISLLDAKHL